MIKRTVAALFIVLSGLFVLVGVPQAQAKAMAINCGGSGCLSLQYWKPITTHGASTSVTMDDPGGTGFSKYEKGLFLHWQNGSWAEVMETRNDNSCGSAHEYYHYEFYDAVTAVFINSACFQVPTGDINGFTTFAIDHFGSGNELDIWMYQTNSGDVPGGCNPCKYYNNDFAGNVTETDYLVHIYDSSISYHVVWGGQWLENQYLSTGSNWHYDGTAGSQSISSTGQPEIFWMDQPNGSYPGGIENSCVYDTSEQCLYGL